MQEPKLKTIMIHNTKLSGFLKSIKDGGLAAPSLAITNNKVGFETFGDISLVVKPDYLFRGKDKVAPSDNNSWVYQSDYYSVRMPTEYATINKVALNVLSSKYDQLPPALTSSFVESQLTNLKGQIVSSKIDDIFERDIAMKLLFIRESSLVEPELKQIKQTTELNAELQFYKEKGEEFASIDPTTEDGKSKFYELHKEFYSAKIDSATTKFVVERLKRSYQSDMDNFALDGITEIFIKDYQERISKSEHVIYKDDIDTYKNEIREVTRSNKTLFEQWVQSHKDSLIKSYSYRDDNNKTINTLSGVVKYKKNQLGVGNEGGNFMSSSHMLAHLNRRLLSVKDVIEQSKNLVKEFEPETLEAKSKLDKLLITISNEWGQQKNNVSMIDFDREYSKDILVSVAEYSQGGKDALLGLQQQFNCDDHSLSKIVSYYEEAKQLVEQIDIDKSQYMEYMDFKVLDLSNDVEMVIAPMDSVAQIEDAFNKNGITANVVSYDPAIENDRLSKYETCTGLESRLGDLEKNKNIDFENQASLSM